MEHVYSHYESDLSDVFNSIEDNLSQLEFNQTNPGGISTDQILVYVNQATNYIEEAEEITQQLEFSSQNSGEISQLRPKITNYNSQIQEYIKRLEKVTGEKKQKSLASNSVLDIGLNHNQIQQQHQQQQKKIRFDDIHINAKEDLDDYEEEEDLNDLRSTKYKTPSEKFKIFMKYHAIKVIVIVILAMTIALIAGYVFHKASKSNPENPVR
ncbi:hypothetical protein DDB_G0287947 [Dictyostelium discoideum AX4]|uniref:Uncharacterized protein n=1 Tax=Dictyostelium discoideum TaxID=44689 RepID=Q54JM8_DICDI|nr:hypothetical protein DDB_G0287947 [Dictyostelium discoideum AX4]EAL63465.1 hypothetical protein DDB_G0287947 [Dictyostelium discoideum AX4]|eukprot:XP_636969.1 hypothetical protein DDB_G0287947 [Dictyostelium discoideum AX4]